MEASVTCPRFAKSVESQVLVPLHPLHFPSSSVHPPLAASSQTHRTVTDACGSRVFANVETAHQVPPHFIVLTTHKKRGNVSHWWSVKRTAPHSLTRRPQRPTAPPTLCAKTFLTAGG